MMATWRSIAFPVFGHRPASVEGATTLGRLLERHGRASGPGRLVEISILDSYAPTPSAEVRQVLDAAVPRVSPYFACVSAIFEGSGFRAAMIRGVLTGFQILSRTKYPQKIFASVGDCAAWVVPFVTPVGGVQCDAETIAGVVEAVKAEGVRRGVLTPAGEIAHPA